MARGGTEAEGGSVLPDDDGVRSAAAGLCLVCDAWPHDGRHGRQAQGDVDEAREWAQNVRRHGGALGRRSRRAPRRGAVSRRLDLNPPLSREYRPELRVGRGLPEWLAAAAEDEDDTHRKLRQQREEKEVGREREEERADAALVVVR